jgi:hypothetical protein
MNSLLVCPHCNGAISRLTQSCPTCGAVTEHGRSRATIEGGYQSPSQSVITIVFDALRTGPGRRRPTTESFSKAVKES